MVIQNSEVKGRRDFYFDVGNLDPFSIKEKQENEYFRLEERHQNG